MKKARNKNPAPKRTGFRWGEAFFRLTLNTALGFVALFLANMAGAYTGVTLGINFFNAGITGLLGAPGFALLYLARWMFS